MGYSVKKEDDGTKTRTFSAKWKTLGVGAAVFGLSYVALSKVIKKYG